MKTNKELNNEIKILRIILIIIVIVLLIISILNFSTHRLYTNYHAKNNKLWESQAELDKVQTEAWETNAKAWEIQSKLNHKFAEYILD